MSKCIFSGHHCTLVLVHFSVYCICREYSERLTTTDYYPVITTPITEYPTIQKLLKYNAVASNKVGQKYTITTFDQGAYRQVMLLLWSNPTLYASHIILMGGFHINKNYIKAFGKKM